MVGSTRRMGEDGVTVERQEARGQLEVGTRRVPSTSGRINSILVVFSAVYIACLSGLLVQQISEALEIGL